MLPCVRLKKRFLESVTLRDCNIFDKYLSVSCGDDDGGGSWNEIYIYIYISWCMYIYVYVRRWSEKGNIFYTAATMLDL